MNQRPISLKSAPVDWDWQRPIYRDPTTLRSEQVCPHCKRKTVEYRVFVDGYPIIIYHCPEHRDVVPMRSAIVRDDFIGVAA